MPKGTDVHVGFFWPQSKQIYRGPMVSIVGSLACMRLPGAPYLVCLFCLQLLEDLERLLLGCEATHFRGRGPSGAQ